MASNTNRKSILIQFLFGIYLLLGMIVSGVQLFSWISGQKKMQIYPD